MNTINRSPGTGSRPPFAGPSKAGIGRSQNDFATRHVSGRSSFDGRGSGGPNGGRDFARGGPSGPRQSFSGYRGDNRLNVTRGASSQFVNRHSHPGSSNWNSGNWGKGNWNGNGNWGKGSGNWNHGGNWNRGNWGGNYNYGWNNYGWNRYDWYGRPWYGYGYGGWGLPLWWLLSTRSFGLPYFGYSSWGYPGYGYGYSYPYYSSYGYSSYGYPATTTFSDAPVILDDQAGAPATATAPSDAASTASSGEFAAAGEDAFRAGDYEGAIRAWRHALLDDPTNGTLVLMLSQAFFAVGNYSEAAGAVQAAMAQVDPDNWGVVVKNFAELYGNSDYTTQLKALETEAKKSPDDPALQFLLGYHYQYLGYPAEAEKKLTRALELAPDDVAAKMLLDVSQGKRPTPPANAQIPGASGVEAPAAPNATPAPTANPPAGDSSNKAESLPEPAAAANET